MLLTTVNTLPGTAFPTRRSSDLEHIASILGKTIFFALLALIALVAIPYGTVEPWWKAAFECGVFGLGALWLIEGFLSGSRSEEHTSELQSRGHLVCRLLLEKKKR